MGKMLEKIALGLALLAGLATVGVFVYTTYLYDAPLPQDEVEFEDMKKEARAVQVIEGVHIEKLIVNLPSNRRRLRFLEISTHFIPFKAEDIELLEKNIPILNDSMIAISSQMDSVELNSVAGKIILEDRVKKRINKALRGQYLKDILFSKYVIQ